MKISVSGLSFDFIGLNFLGHSCYAAFNIALYWFSAIQVDLNCFKV